ncbi:hypothetical protein GCM10014715_89120 [Streptomyces spiralis]|uniref:Uncharacterized protein n=1 Tax=Streptomyces spiralis TaxID=66376 RepID=A0A919E7S4_9ACTN|nr:hypothetical protein [Streptomyces spiralis]GHF21030.1 hypothetical protein GCM10014715_89120 [Streptomyces spiralis]
MSVTIFTTGSVSYVNGEDGADVLRVEFDDDTAEEYQRVELATGGRLETNGFIAESFGRGGAMLEIVGLANLRKRGGSDPELKSEAAGTCWLDLDDDWNAVCTQGSCTGTCVKKYWHGVFLYCSCR